MNRNERFENTNETLLAAVKGERADIWTAIPAIVQSFNPVAMTCAVQPTIRFRVLPPASLSYNTPTMTVAPSGQFIWDQMPLLTDCPVQFPGGGGVTLTFPINPGDEVLVILASRCIDAWWAYGGIQNQNAMRMHDLSDGFIIPQVRSQPRKFTVSTTSAQLRNDAGTAYIQLNATSGEVDVVAPTITATAAGTITATAGTSATVTAPIVTINGNLAVTGTISAGGAVSAPSLTVAGNATINGTLTNAGKDIGPTHKHSGVTVGSGNTGSMV